MESPASNDREDFDTASDDFQSCFDIDIAASGFNDGSNTNVVEPAFPLQPDLSTGVYGLQNQLDVGVNQYHQDPQNLCVDNYAPQTQFPQNQFLRQDAFSFDLNYPTEAGADPITGFYSSMPDSRLGESTAAYGYYDTSAGGGGQAGYCDTTSTLVSIEPSMLPQNLPYPYYEENDSYDASKANIF